MFTKNRLIRRAAARKLKAAGIENINSLHVRLRQQAERQEDQEKREKDNEKKG